MKLTLYTLMFFIFIISIKSEAYPTSSKPNNTNSKKTNTHIPWIKNIGQYPSKVSFSAKTLAADIFIENNNSIHYLINSDKNNSFDLKEIFIKSASSNSNVNGIDKSQTIINILNGKNSKSYNNIPTYNTIDLGEIWYGINVSLKSTSNNFEKIFTISPNSKADQINIQIEGATDICELENKELQVDFQNSNISFTKPIAYQNINGKINEIDVYYIIKSKSPSLSYGFKLGNYNTKFPVIIDPLISSSYIGGSLIDYAKKIQIGKSGNVYIGGSTASSNFPVSSSTYDNTHNSEMDVFICMFNSDLSQLDVCTFVGGSRGDYLFDMVLDDEDNVYFTGETKSTNYPTTTNAFDTTFNNPINFDNGDMMITMLSNKLDAIIYSTFVGNDDSDYAIAMDIDKSGDILVTGLSTNGIPTVGPQFYPTTNDFVFFKMDNELSTILASNSITGEGHVIPTDMTIDSSDNVLITGSTTITDFPTTTNIFSDTLIGEEDIFILKLNNDLSTILASTYFGDRLIDIATNIIVDPDDNIFITGTTNSPKFPTTIEAYDTLLAYNINDPLPDAFISKLAPDLKEVLASTFVGGKGDESGYSLALDSNGDIFISGFTSSIDFPVYCNSYNQTNNGVLDCFMGKLNSQLTTLLSSTYFGGEKNDHAYSLDINEAGDIYVVGSTESQIFPTLISYDSIYNGGLSDGFVVKFESDFDKRYPCCSSLLEPTAQAINIPKDFKIVWEQARGATGYFISIGSTSDTFDILNYFNNGDATTYNALDLPCGDSIFVKIFPYNAYGVNLTCETLWFKTVEPFLHKEEINICNGDTIVWRSNKYYIDSLYEEKYIDINGCDSIYQLKLNIHNDIAIYDTISICGGNTYNWNGNEYTQTGIYYINDTTIYGCDSIAQLNLLVHNTFKSIDTATICKGDYFAWQGGSFYLPGLYTKEYIDINGCDSIYQLKLIVNPTYQFRETSSICEGDVFQWQGSSFDSTGNYSKYYTTILGCDSTYNLSLKVLPNYNITLNDTICQGDTTYIDGTGYYSEGNYTIDLQTQDGCDSTINYNLYLNPHYQFFDTLTICQGDTIFVNGNAYYSAGNYTLKNQTIYGCDSIINLVVNISDKFNLYDTTSICQGDTLIWEGKIITQGGNYTNDYSSNGSCDTVKNLMVSVDDSYYIFDSIQICSGDSYNWQGQNLNSPGTFSAQYQTINGCDSIYYLTLGLNPIYNFEDEQTICKNGSVIWQGKVLTVPGEYFAFHSSIEGCDSNFHLVLKQIIIDTSVYISEDSLITNLDTTATYQWMNCPDFEVINGATESFYIATQDGSYAVSVNINGCIDTSSCHNIIISKTTDINKNIELLVYPNPVSKNELQIKLTNTDKSFSLKLNDLRGQEILKKSKLFSSDKLKLDKLKTGIYLLTINVENTILHKKVIVIR